MKKVLEVTISGPPKSGKTALALIVREAVEKLGIVAKVDGLADESNSSLLRKNDRKQEIVQNVVELVKIKTQNTKVWDPGHVSSSDEFDEICREAKRLILEGLQLPPGFVLRQSFGGDFTLSIDMAKPDNITVFVLSGNHLQYRGFLNRIGIKSRVVFISGEHSVMGYDPNKSVVCYVGTWYDNSLCPAVADFARRGATMCPVGEHESTHSVVQRLKKLGVDVRPKEVRAVLIGKDGFTKEIVLPYPAPPIYCVPVLSNDRATFGVPPPLRFCERRFQMRGGDDNGVARYEEI